ncbi:hypothetical protein [Miniimonas sp. S16]|uniref:LppM family (lipo)protein n=1 Tax=Miniimonas sp. S16 TaxID=2171623 RepID=UPI000D5257C1|nr:hypothetical protein [Miniimonas sp. S16]
MRHRRLRSAVTAAVTVAVAALALAGCVRADAELEVDGRNDTVTGTIDILVPLTENSDAGRQTAAQQATAIEQRVLPGIRDVTGVEAAPEEEDGYYGTELDLERVSIEDLYLGDPTAEGALPIIERQGDRFVVHATLDTTGQEAVPAPGAAGERPAGAAESTITIALTFPGPVQEVRGTEDAATVDGNTVTWLSSWDTPLVLDATASATAASFPPWIWEGLLWGGGGLVVLALLGLLTVWWRSRND